MGYNNEEIFPKNGIKEPFNAYIDVVIKGAGNIIEHSARNVIVNGENNYVGDGAKNINIFNSSGCIVSSGVIGCTLISSSGVIVNTDGLCYINNTLINNNSIPTGSYVVVTSNYSLTSSNDTVEIKKTSSGNFYLPSCIGNNRKFNIKNSSLVLHSIYPANGSETIDGNSLISIGTLDSVTVQSDGVSNYIII